MDLVDQGRYQPIRALAAGVVLLALLTSGCSDDGDSGRDASG